MKGICRLFQLWRISWSRSGNATSGLMNESDRSIKAELCKYPQQRIPYDLAVGLRYSPNLAPKSTPSWPRPSFEPSPLTPPRRECPHELHPTSISSEHTHAILVVSQCPPSPDLGGMCTYSRFPPKQQQLLRRAHLILINPNLILLIIIFPRIPLLLVLIHKRIPLVLIFVRGRDRAFPVVHLVRFGFGRARRRVLDSRFEEDESDG